MGIFHQQFKRLWVSVVSSMLWNVLREDGAKFGKLLWPECAIWHDGE
jgi:hypothetical protein